MDTWGEVARGRIADRKLSLRQVADLLHINHAYLSRVLSGKQNPSLELVQALDKLLEAEGALVDMAGVLTDDDRRRLAYTIRNPTRMDAAAVAALSAVLAAERRADDAVPPTVLVRATEAKTTAMTHLLRETHGPIHDKLGAVVAEYWQFSGWLNAELRRDRTALHQLRRAYELSPTGELRAQALNFQAYVARQRNDSSALARLFQAAYWTPGSSPAQRMGDAAQAVQGLVGLGRRDDALRLLDRAMRLQEEAERNEPPGTAYWLTANFQRFNFGIAYLSLAEPVQAAALFRQGLAGLPPEQRNAEWTEEHKQFLAQAEERS